MKKNAICCVLGALLKKEDILKHGFYLNQQLLDEGLARPMMG